MRKGQKILCIHIHQSLWVLRHSINININSIKWVIGFYLDTFILFSLTSSQEQNIIGRPPIVFIETIKETVRIRSKQNGKEIGYGLGSDLLFFYKFLLNVMKGNKRKNLFWLFLHISIISLILPRGSPHILLVLNLFWLY